MHGGDEHGKDCNCQDCGNSENCGGGCGGHGHKKAKLYFFAGILAIVYGVVNYLTVSMGWPNYQAWIAGGVLLLLVGALKKHV